MNNKLRPSKLCGFVGHKRVKELLDIVIKASLFRGEQLKHILFFGPPGTGKTTLCYVVASELNTKIHPTTGVAIEKASDLLSLLINIKKGDILFIDEIHRLPVQLEELIYSAMEDGYIDLVVDAGDSKKSVRFNLPPFTLLGATTKIGNLSKPLRSRFSYILKLDYYTASEIKQIIYSLGRKYNTHLKDSVIDKIVLLSRDTPRLAVNAFLQLRDIAEVISNGEINEKVITKAFDLLGVTQSGINSMELKYLSVLVNTYNGGPVGVETLSLTLGETILSVSENLEPYLLRKEFIKYTKSGRVALPKAYKIVKEINNGS